jgi:hypothetical protein
MGYIKNLVDFIIRMQDKYRKDLESCYQEGRGRVAQLRILGTTGEGLLLKEDGGTIRYADQNDQAVDVFQCSEDTFLDILAAAITGKAKGVLRQKWNNNHFVIMNAGTGEVDIVQIEKWARGFDTWGGLLHMAGLKSEDVIGKKEVKMQ